MEADKEETWITEEISCLNCGHQWVAVHPDSKLLECSSCGFRTHSERHSPPPFHFVVSRVNDATYIKPSRAMSRLEIMGLLTEAIGMLQASDKANCTPQDCRLNIVVNYFGENE